MSCEAVGALLDASHLLHPDEIQPTVSALASSIGADALDIFVVDYDQRRLMPLGDGEPLDIEGTLAGRAYQLQQVQADNAEGVVRVWVPMVDGSDRLGILGATIVDDDDNRVVLRWLATVIAEMLASKTQFGDGIELARRTRDMDLAAELRWAMLPPLTFTEPRFAVSGVLQPAYSIAGDCFDYAVNGDTAHLAILDAMGHGLEASRMANLAVTAYRHARRRSHTMKESFEAVDRVVAQEFGPDKFVTGQLAELSLVTGTVNILNAGHPRPLLVRGGTHVSEVACDVSLPLGLGGIPGEQLSVPLEPGDRLLFFTDGVTEARSASGELFGRDRLADLLVRAVAADLSVAETVRRLGHAVIAHEGAELHDDATLLLVRWTGPART